MCVLLLLMVCSAWLLVVGDEEPGQQALYPGRGMLLRICNDARTNTHQVRFLINVTKIDLRLLESERHFHDVIAPI